MSQKLRQGKRFVSKCLIKCMKSKITTKRNRLHQDLSKAVLSVLFRAKMLRIQDDSPTYLFSPTCLRSFFEKGKTKPRSQPSSLSCLLYNNSNNNKLTFCKRKFFPKALSHISASAFFHSCSDRGEKATTRSVSNSFCFLRVRYDNIIFGGSQQFKFRLSNFRGICTKSMT